MCRPSGWSSATRWCAPRAVTPPRWSRTHEAEDYVDQRLAAFEVVLDRTMATVKRGREQLQVHTGSPALAEAEPDLETDEPGFFDQDN